MKKILLLIMFNSVKNSPYYQDPYTLQTGTTKKTPHPKTNYLSGQNYLLDVTLEKTHSIRAVNIFNVIFNLKHTSKIPKIASSHCY